MKKILSIDSFGPEKYIVKFNGKRPHSEFFDFDDIGRFIQYAKNWNETNPDDKILLKYEMRDEHGNLCLKSLARNNTNLIQRSWVRDIDDEVLEFCQTLVDLKQTTLMCSEVLISKIKTLSKNLAESEKLVTDKKITTREIDALKTITAAANIFNDSSRKVSESCDAILDEWDKSFNAVCNEVLW